MSRFILVADDYALTGGVCEAVLALADAGRISATGTMVNLPAWPDVAAAAVARRDRIALGLHLNLTHGAPLGPLPALAPGGALPGLGRLLRAALSGRLDAAEIGAEIARQLDRFEAVAGFAPDFVDGHQHVHVLPGVRGALLAEMRRRYPVGGPLLRDPVDSLAAILRRAAPAKAVTVAALALGFRRAARAAGFAVNRGFAGFSTFGRLSYAAEFETLLTTPGPRPMIMCHPGFADHAAAAIDAIAPRRMEEYAFLAARPGLPEILWRPARSAAAAEFPW